MLSLQATDISVASGSGSASVASSSADAHSQSVSMVEESSSVQKPLTARKLELVGELDIPMRLTCEFPGKSLCDFWERYQAGLEAISKCKTNKPRSLLPTFLLEIAVVQLEQGFCQSQAIQQHGKVAQQG